MINIDELKKKIIYRSNYRGTKEMDNLLGAFTKKYINNLNENDLLDLEKLLNIDDTNLYNFYNGFKTDFEFENNNINYLYKNFNFTQKWWRRDWDSNPGKSCPFAGFQDRCFQPLSHLSVSMFL